MKFFRRKGLICFVIVLFSIYNFYPSVAFAQRERVKVGFIGFKIDGVGDGVKRDITNGVLYLLAKKRFVEIVSPDEAILIVGREKIDSVLSYPSENEIMFLTAMLGVDYLFFGRFVNQGVDTNDVNLFGKFECFDRLKRKFHSVEITWRYENIDKEIKEIDKKFISKILPGGSVMPNLFFIIVLVLITVGTYTLIWELGSGSSGEGSELPTVQ